MKNGIIDSPRLAFALFAFLFASSTAFAKNIYVSQSGAGSQNGADLADAYSLSWLNAANNWGPGGLQVNPGDTVDLLGTFTNTLTIQGSGSAGNPVTVLFTPGANFTTGCWPAQAVGAISLNLQSYITIDGGGSGIIQNTSNGTGLATTNDSSGIGGEGYFIAIQNLTITNIYVSQPGDVNNLGYPLNISGNCITLSNCSLSWGDACCTYTGPQETSAYTTESNIFFINNTLNHFNHGFFLYIGDNPNNSHNLLLTNLVITGNTFSPWGDFYDEPGNHHHNDDIIIANNTDDATCVMAGLRCYQNTFTPHLANNGSSAFFLNVDNNTSQYQNFFVYNNLFLATSNSWNDGFITAVGSNIWIINNDFIGNGGPISSGGTNSYFFNNYQSLNGGVVLDDVTGLSVTNANTCLNVGWVLSNVLQNAWSDYNVYSGGSGFGFVVYSSSGGVQLSVASAFTTLLGWQTYNNNGCGWSSPIWNTAHCDPHSNTNFPRFVAGTYIPMPHDIVATGAGTNLTFLGITNDFNGNPRPATGPWDIGAFVHAVSSGNTLIAPPANVRAAPPGSQ